MPHHWKIFVHRMKLFYSTLSSILKERINKRVCCHIFRYIIHKCQRKILAAAPDNRNRKFEWEMLTSFGPPTYSNFSFQLLLVYNTGTCRLPQCPFFFSFCVFVNFLDMFHKKKRTEKFALCKLRLIAFFHCCVYERFVFQRWQKNNNVKLSLELAMNISTRHQC